MYETAAHATNMIYNIIATGLVGYYLQYVIYVPVIAIGWIIAVARVYILQIISNKSRSNDIINHILTEHTCKIHITFFFCISLFHMQLMTR